MASNPVYTKATLLTECRTLLMEPTALFWSDTELNAWIDRGARKLSQITLCIPHSEDITTAASVYEYTLTSSFIKVEHVFYSNTGLQRVDIRNFGNGACVAASGTAPKWYYQFGECIYLWPSPAISLTVSVYGYRSAIAYDDATDPPTKHEIPNALQPLIINYVLSCAYAKAGKHSLARFHMIKFLSDCSMHRRDVTDRGLIADSLDRFQIPDRTVTAQ